MRLAAPLPTTAFALSCVLLAGCAHANGSNPFSDGPDRTEIEITVRNEALRPRDVYVYWSLGSRQWLGTVPAETAESFKIRFRSDGIRFSGGPQQYFPVFPGDRIEILYPEIGQVLPPRRVR